MPSGERSFSFHIEVTQGILCRLESVRAMCASKGAAELLRVTVFSGLISKGLQLTTHPIRVQIFC